MDWGELSTLNRTDRINFIDLNNTRDVKYILNNLWRV